MRSFVLDQKNKVREHALDGVEIWLLMDAIISHVIDEMC